MAFSVGAVGAWVSERVADGVLRATSGAAALYVTNFVEPYVQSAAEGGSLSAEEIAKLDTAAELLKARRHVVSIKIWRPDGTIVYSTQKSLIGRRFSTEDILPALRGEITAGMADFQDDDGDFERSLAMPLYEMFLPLFSPQNDKIVAVAEIYEDAHALLRDRASAVGTAWLVVGSVGLCTLLLLFAIVHQGSATIQRQRSAIKQRFREKMLLHRKNDILKSEVENALRTSARIDDLVHTRLGAELHDGPVQLMSFVLLRLDEVEKELKDRPPHAKAVLQQLRGAMEEALKELRAISAGLFLPDMADTGNAAEVVRKIIRAHECRTGCVVEYRTTEMPEKLPREIVRCLARVTQEALNNAYKHCGSNKQCVMLGLADGKLRLCVRDDGRGISRDKTSGSRSGLGLPGMEARMRAVGGTFSARTEKGRGTEILCAIPMVNDMDRFLHTRSRNVEGY
jgi:signal transduction histidine kinase